MLIEALPYHSPLAWLASFAALPGTVLLESVSRHPERARYSFMGVDPFEVLQSGAHDTEDALAALQTRLERYRQPPSAQVPAALPGAAMGYFSYDLCARLESISLPNDNTMDWPDMMLGLYDLVLTIDHVEQCAWLVSTGLPEQSDAAKSTRARCRMDWFLNQCQSVASSAEPVSLSTGVVKADAIRSNFSKAEYQNAVRSVIDYIRAGDIFEANIAQRFQTPRPNDLSAFDLYQRMRTHNAAPFAAYLNYHDRAIVSASPERFLWLNDGVVETRPIKGTCPRGRTASEDQAYANALLKSEKDRAENTMIVDLMRNDLSRVCQPHSVEVSRLCGLESFETVHHLVSVVRGRLRNGLGAVDLLRASFPGGSITGAPKIRSMEIISELEPHRRGPYCGTVGYLGFDGRMDTSITIRTFLLHDKQITFQAGGAVTMDSDPEAEYQETLDKVAAMKRCLVGGHDSAH